MNKDTLIVNLSDMHSGGTTALFPKRFWQFTHTNHTPTSDQKRMFDHFSYCAKEVLKARKDKRLIVVHDGDAIDGDHHSSLQIVTRMKNEQIEIHIELMDYFLQTTKFDKRTDDLYYVSGTEVHTGDTEDSIGDDLGAVRTEGGLSAFDELELMVNGKMIWFVHHGPTAGKGANMGNTMRNWLKNNFFERVLEGERPPDYIITGHTHQPYWNDYIGRHKGKYFKVQGLICPSWQMKTRYGYKAAPMQKAKIGLQYFTVTKDGMISDPTELLMK